MTTKHTPGPWKAHKPAQSEGVPSDGWTIRFDGPSHQWHVATVYGQEKPTGIKYDQGENAANARLIAAAPDLLAALKRAELELNNIYNNRNRCSVSINTIEGVSVAAKEARAAIRKAEVGAA